jgi:hypothetical protein
MSINRPRQCANSNESVKCGNPPLPHHIFCEACRVALGGYTKTPSTKGGT